MAWQSTWTIDPKSKRRSGNQGSVIKVLNGEGMSAALKEMNVENALRRERVARFEAEAAALTHLDVMGVPRTIETGSGEDGTPYFICEWIEGQTLQEFVNGRPLELELALKISLQLATILVGIHSHGVVHRDIKPDNIIITEAERLWVVDFGISWFERETEDQQLTILNDSRMGNHFLALPEFLDRGEKRDPRSDVTQTVGILFFLLTGAKPAQLRDAYLLPPHQGPLSARFLERAKASVGWPTILSTFDIGFAQTLSHRFQTAAQFYEHLQIAVAPVHSQTADGSSSLASALASYSAARMAISAQIDEIESALLIGLNQIAAAIAEVAVPAGFDGPLQGFSRVERPGHEVAVLWDMKHKLHNEPHIYYKVRACLTGESRDRVELRLTAQHSPISSFDKRYYETFSADITGLVRAGVSCANQIFADALGDLTSKFRR